MHGTLRAVTRLAATQWPSIKPLRIFAPTNGQQGGTWQVFRASSASCSGQVQASESTTEIMNVFFHFRNMHSKCSFMVTVSTFKCIFLKYCLVYATTPLPEMHFFQKFFGLYIDSHVFFHFRKKIKCIFSNIVKLMSRRNPFFHFQKCILNALFMVTVSTFKCIFSNIVWCMLQLKCIFFASANAFQMLIHGDYFHIQTSYCFAMFVCTHPYTRECAHSRVQNNCRKGHHGHSRSFFENF